ncbi:MAG: hypothetical protein JWO03_1859 [Bacteroidetes bacterium]|nr:hypothetical protein [Bacteroidota bacterium]
MMKKNTIKYICFLFLMINGHAGWSQKSSCSDYFDSRILIAKTRLAQSKAPAGSKAIQDLQMKLEDIEKQKDSCMASQDNTSKTVPLDTVKQTAPATAPATIPQPREAEPKKDSAVNTPKDNKLPPAEPVHQNKKPEPNKNPKPRPVGPPVKPIVKDTTPPPAPKPEKGLDYNQKIDTLDRNVNSFKVRVGNKEFYYIVVDLDKSDIKLHLHHTKDKYVGHNFSTIEALLSSQEINIAKTEMITNGGMYMHNGQPQGLYIENGKMMAPIDTADPKNGDNFHLMPNGVFFIKNGEAHILTTDSFKKTELGDSNISYATQSGPMLVIDGKRHSVFTEGSHNEKLRSGVCVINKKTVVFAICDQINFWDFANFFKDYIKGHNALFLDGSVSRMYLKKGLKENIRKDMDGTFGPMISVTEK